MALEKVAVIVANRVRIVTPRPLPELPEGVLTVDYFFAYGTVGNAVKYTPRADVIVLLAVGRDL